MTTARATLRTGSRFVALLPPGEWRGVVYRGSTIFVCADHPPRVVDKDGNVAILKGLPADFPTGACSTDASKPLKNP